MDFKKIYVCGHRNPDCDSIMSAYALADLRRRTGWKNVQAICPGRLPERAKWAFSRFGLPPPPSRSDVYVRVEDLIDKNVPSLSAEMTLLDGLRTLAASGESSLPVAARDGTFLGMLSPAKLLSLFIAKDDLSRRIDEAPLHKEMPLLKAHDRAHDVQALAVRSAHNHFPVVDDHDRLLGTVLKRAFAEAPPFRMVLVDHNETAQGIPGVEELPILEVVDHHRISFAPTAQPIRYTADVVGSTCTIVARMFRGAGLRPGKEIAGLMLAGIVSDTLLFMSPTTTQEDRTLAAWLEKISLATAGELMDGMMSVGSVLTTLSAEQAIETDRKTYNERALRFSLAQIEETNLAIFHRKTGELRDGLLRIRTAENLDFIALLVTDPVRGRSELLFSGSETVRRALPWRTNAAGIFDLPGVLSRKKQLLPEILACLP